MEHRWLRGPAPSAFFLFAFLLIAIGPATASAGDFTHRVVGVAYDFDNNGVADANAVISYDASGRPTTRVYTYTGDGVPDLFNTEDDDSARDDTVIGFNADDLVDSVSLDRQLMPSGTEEFDTTLSFVAGELDEVLFESMANGISGSSTTTFSYDAGRIDLIEDRMTSNGALLFTQTLSYGGDDLPDQVVFDSDGIDSTTDFTWRSDGQIASISSVNSSGGMPLGGGDADYVYDAQGRLESEVWTIDGAVGSFYTEFPGETYRKSHAYDAQNLKITEMIDIGDDGSVEATRTIQWEEGPCVPAFLWAPNGRPNFTRMEGLPYVQGTGAQWFENCGPIMVPEPGRLVAGLGCGGGLWVLAAMRRARRSGARA